MPSREYAHAIGDFLDGRETNAILRNMNARERYFVHKACGEVNLNSEAVNRNKNNMADLRISKRN